jgi:hypothetical protein
MRRDDVQPRVAITRAITAVTWSSAAVVAILLVNSLRKESGPDLALIINESDEAIRTILEERIGGGGWMPPLGFSHTSVLKPCGACGRRASLGPRWDISPNFVRFKWVADDPSLSDATPGHELFKYVQERGILTEPLPLRSARVRPTDRVVLYRFDRTKRWTIQLMSCEELEAQGYECSEWHKKRR